MSSTHHCTQYDASLKASLTHLQNYPQYMPFIGSAWETQKDKVLFVAESHYLPKTSNDKSNYETWYTNNSSFLTPEDKCWINTREIVKGADHYSISNKKNYAKGHTIFYNIKAAIFDARQIKNRDQTLFEYFGYYNYFQRPAEKTGLSIQTTGLDNRIAYNTLKAIAENTAPTTIIFTSKKAFNSFGFWRNKEKDAIFNTNEIAIHHVPHPSSAWWNKPSKAYNNNTGKARFIEIIKNLNLQLS